MNSSFRCCFQSCAVIKNAFVCILCTQKRHFERFLIDQNIKTIIPAIPAMIIVNGNRQQPLDFLLVISGPGSEGVTLLLACWGM